MSEAAVRDAGDDDARASGRRGRPHAFIAFVVLAMAVAFVVHTRREGVFACPAGGYDEGYYLANCNAADYGEYDHGAWWFGIEGEAARHAAGADVVFLGNSRLQYAFSAPATDDWFASLGQRYYLLGFAYDQSAAFSLRLIDRLDVRARAYIINTDRYFRDDIAGPGVEVMEDPTAYTRMLWKRAWQMPHRVLCSIASGLCGAAPAMFRSVRTGRWTLEGDVRRYPDAFEEIPLNTAAVERAAPIARRFVDSLSSPRQCVFFTYVWTPYNERADAEALAEAVGVPFVSPRVDGLTTIDGSHLDEPSAQRFSQAVFEEIGPQLEQCLAARPTENGD